MILIDRLIIGGVKFVLTKVAAAVEQELNDDTVLRERLLTAQMQLDEGVIDAATFNQIERDIFARMREMKSSEQVGGIADASSFEDVEIEVADDEHS